MSWDIFICNTQESLGSNLKICCVSWSAAELKGMGQECILCAELGMLPPAPQSAAVFVSFPLKSGGRNNTQTDA